MPPNDLQNNPTIMAQFRELADAMKKRPLLTIEVKDRDGKVLSTITDVIGATIGYLTPERIAFPLRVGLRCEGDLFSAGMILSALVRSRDTATKAHPLFEEAEELTRLLLDANGGTMVAMGVESGSR